MCYPKPGPRCSYHAKEKLKKEQSKNPIDKKKLLQAQKDYYSTPQGQERLQKLFVERNGSISDLETEEDLPSQLNSIRNLINQGKIKRESQLQAYYVTDLKEQDAQERKLCDNLSFDHVDTLVAINDNVDKIVVAGQELEYIDDAGEIDFARNHSKATAEYLSHFSTPLPEEADDPYFIPLKTVSCQPIGDKISQHYANQFIYKGKKYICDLSYKAIDPNVEVPYVTTVERWKHGINQASLVGPKEYIAPAEDPRKKILPKTQPGEYNPLAEKGILGDKYTNRDGTISRYLEVDQVKVAYVKYVVKNKQPYLHTIETRPEYKRQGYMKTLLSRLTEEYGHKPYSSGSYTPEGYNYTQHLTQQQEDRTPQINYPEYTSEKPLTVVKDWIEGVTD